MEKDYREQIDRSKKRLAKCLNLLEAVHDELEFVFERRSDWNSAIQWQLDEGVVKLGFALATLSNWYNEEENEQKGKSMITISTFHYMNRPIRIVETNGKIYFVIRDICDIIGFSNPNRALSMYTTNVPLYTRLPTPGGMQVVRLVPEADVEQLLRGYDTRTTLLLHVWLISTVYPALESADKKRQKSYRMLSRRNTLRDKRHANR